MRGPERSGNFTKAAPATHCFGISVPARITVVQVDGKQIEDVPKSYAARSMPIPSFVAELLSKHIERRRVELDVDAATLRAQLTLLADKNDELDRVRKHEGELTARLAEVRAVLDARIKRLQEDRDARICRRDAHRTRGRASGGR